VATASRRAPHEVRWLQLRYGEALLAYGDARGSREQAQSILAFNPRHPASLLLLARSEAMLGDTGAARAALERLRAELAKSDPDWPVRTAAEALRAKLGLAPAV
jgi:predicted Zn-dependent protease